MNGNVLIHYSASINASFSGTIDTGISKADWAQMSEDERSRAIDDEVYQLVEIGVEDE